MVVAIISLLVSILLPSLNKAKALARDTVCMTKHRSMVSAWNLYAEEHGGTTMYVFAGWSNSQDYWWVNLIDGYLGADWNGKYDTSNSFFTDWFCPSVGPCEQAKRATPENVCWLGMNRLLGKKTDTIWLTNAPENIHDPPPSLSDFHRPGQTPVFCDLTSHQSWYQEGSKVFTYRHGGETTSNYALADGHVEARRSKSHFQTTDLNGDGVTDGFPPEDFVWNIFTNETGYHDWDYSLFQP